MKNIFTDILGIEGVHGAILLNTEGAVAMSSFSTPYQDEESAIAQSDWNGFALELTDLKEAEFLFEQIRLYVRKTAAGSLVVVMDDIAPISMVRLNCEILLPALDRIKPAGSKIGKILRKKIF